MKNKRGFTLLEIMTVVAIIGIMAGVSLMFVSTKKEEVINAQARELASTIRDIQDRALNGSSGNALASCGFGFYYYPTDSTWHIYRIVRQSGWADCSEVVSFQDDTSAGTPDTLIKDIPDGLSMSVSVVATATQVQEVAFDAPFAHIFAYDVDGNDVSGTLQFAFSLSGDSRYVCLTNSGLVIENGKDPC